MPAPRHLAIFLALLLAGATAAAVPATAVPAGPAETDGLAAPVVVPLANTTNQVSPEGVTRREYVRADVDVAGAVAVGAARLGGRHETLTLSERLDRVDSPEARLAAVRATLDRVEARLATLDRMQGELYAAYSDGSLSTAAFLRRLAHLETTAAQQREVVAEISRRAETSSLSLPVTTQTRIDRLRASLVVLPNPNAETVVGAVSGNAPARTMYVEGAPDGLVTATVRDGTYRRVATVRADRRPGEPNRFATGSDQPINVALARATELYPWLFDNIIGGRSIRGFSDTSVYLIEAAHPQGDISTYLDGATRNVFHEIQTKDPATVPVSANLTNVTQDLQLRVETTYPTGPLSVRLTRPGIGTGVDAPVRINGRVVGETGVDGRLLTVQPVGPFRVNATAGGETVAITTP